MDLIIVTHELSCLEASGILPDPTPVPCIDRQILNHWNTREVLSFLKFIKSTLRYFQSISSVQFSCSVVSDSL